ncbi:hypothetical protein LNP74_10385 [Klebsiella pneumoniae subsp. pneumoniae]|nr:hypothetical protein [Klebsiella pneumoniae subsp. pneumoniae]
MVRSARRGSTARPRKPHKTRGREAQPAGNSAMMDALAAAMGKNAAISCPFLQHFS